MRSVFLHMLLIGLVSAQPLLAQVKTQTPPREQPDEVLRVKTELVQTDVIVVDKHGRFVDGLTANDFELRVDSKLQPLSFFEQVVTGSVDEEQQLTAARQRDATTKLQPTSKADRGRVIFFFVDDIHLTAEGLTRARSL